jgi:hypothetical protein
MIFRIPIARPFKNAKLASFFKDCNDQHIIRLASGFTKIPFSIFSSKVERFMSQITKPIKLNEIFIKFGFKISVVFPRDNNWLAIITSSRISRFASYLVTSLFCKLDKLIPSFLICFLRCPIVCIADDIALL